jgi:hypothetical protein
MAIAGLVGGAIFPPAGLVLGILMHGEPAWFGPQIVLSRTRGGARSRLSSRTWTPKRTSGPPQSVGPTKLTCGGRLPDVDDGKIGHASKSADPPA